MAPEQPHESSKGYDPWMTRRSARQARAELIPLAGFVYVLYRPVSNGSILLPIVLGLGLCGLLGGLQLRNRLAGVLVLLLFIEILFGLTFSLVGRNNPGLTDQMKVFLGFPIVFWLMIFGINERILRHILAALAVGCIAVAATVITYVGNQQGILPQIIPASFLQAQTGARFFDAGSIGSNTAIQFYGLATLAAGAPLWVSSLLVPSSRLLPAKSVRVTAAVTCTVAALIAGRQAIVVTAVLAPVFLSLASWMIGRSRADRLLLTKPQLRQTRARRLGLIFSMLAAIVLLSRVAFRSTTVSAGTIAGAYNSLKASVLGADTGTADTVTRAEESHRLLSAFNDHPLVGSGLGATLSDYQRNPVKPWDFELQYHMLLFTTGIAGAVFALAAASVFVYSARLAVRQQPDLAGCIAVTTVGCLAFLAATASNPYLQAPGYNWALYLPLAAINVALTSADALPSLKSTSAALNPNTFPDSKARLTV